MQREPRADRHWDGNGGTLCPLFCFLFLFLKITKKTERRGVVNFVVNCEWYGKRCGKLVGECVRYGTARSRVFRIVFLYPAVFRIVFRAQVSRYEVT